MSFLLFFHFNVTFYICHNTQIEEDCRMLVEAGARWNVSRIHASIPQYAVNAFNNNVNMASFLGMLDLLCSVL
jgi:hypothetical protein